MAGARRRGKVHRLRSLLLLLMMTIIMMMMMMIMILVLTLLPLQKGVRGSDSIRGAAGGGR